MSAAPSQVISLARKAVDTGVSSKDRRTVVLELFRIVCESTKPTNIGCPGSEEQTAFGVLYFLALGRPFEISGIDADLKLHLQVDPDLNLRATQWSAQQVLFQFGVVKFPPPIDLSAVEPAIYVPSFMTNTTKDNPDGVDLYRFGSTRLLLLLSCLHSMATTARLSNSVLDTLSPPLKAYAYGLLATNVTTVPQDQRHLANILRLCTDAEQAQITIDAFVKLFDVTQESFEALERLLSKMPGPIANAIKVEILNSKRIVATGQNVLPMLRLFRDQENQVFERLTSSDPEFLATILTDVAANKDLPVELRLKAINLLARHPLEQLFEAFGAVDDHDFGVWTWNRENPVTILRGAMLDILDLSAKDLLANESIYLIQAYLNKFEEDQARCEGLLASYLHSKVK